MIVLYTLLVVALGAAKFLMDRRAARLETKYAGTAEAAERLLREQQLKGGTNTRPDPCLAAKRQYELGLLVRHRDRLEGKYVAWHRRADGFGRLVARVRGWKGKKLPYTLGVVDVSLLLGLLDSFGVGDYVSVRRLVQAVAGHFVR